MKIRPSTEGVTVILTPREAVDLAGQLVKSALKSGGTVEDERPEPTEPDV